MLRSPLLPVAVAVVVAGILLAGSGAEVAIPVGFAAGLVVATALLMAGRRETVALRADLADARDQLQRRARELATERERVERLLDALPTGILLFEPSRLAYANPTAQSIFSVARQESRSPLQVLGVEALADAVAEVREAGGSVDVEVERAERHLTVHVAATGAGVVAMVVSDVTESRRLEAVRRDFVINASHELKTPVAGIQALSDSLRLAVERDPERARQMTARLQHEAERLGKLVRDLLDLTRLEDIGSHGLDRQRVDVTEVARRQAERLAPLAGARQVRVRCHLKEPAWVIAAPDDIDAIVGNLLENALRYNEPSGWVDVRVERAASNVVLEISDNGIGIPEAHRDRVFERFYRVDKARSRAAGGTGLGLAIVRHAAQRHGGDVSLNTVLGEGSTFRVVLPVEGAETGG